MWHSPFTYMLWTVPILTCLVWANIWYVWSTVYQHQGWFRFAPSQWETLLQSNTVSHWMGANLESALELIPVTARSSYTLPRSSCTPIWQASTARAVRGAFLRRAMNCGTCITGQLWQSTTSLHTWPITWDIKMCLCPSISRTDKTMSILLQF